MGDDGAVVFFTVLANAVYADIKYSALVNGFCRNNVGHKVRIPRLAKNIDRM